MKALLKLVCYIFIISLMISCKKEYSCENCAATNKPPIALAGPDQVITLPTDSVSLDGRQSSDPDGTISSYLWTKISGPASFIISNTASALTVAKNLATGTHQFELKVTDNVGLIAKDTVQISVIDPSPSNRPPVANAGADQTITLPTNTAILDGSASTDPDNNIVSYLWAKISGPSPFNIANANTIQTQVNNLMQGIYQFELKVTDAGGLFDLDTVQLTITADSIYVSCDNSNRKLVSVQLLPFATIPAQFFGQAAYGYKAEAAGDKLLFLSRVLHNGGSPGASSPIHIYNITTATWTTVELSIPRWADGVATLNNNIYFAGGVISDYNGDSAFYTPAIDIYNAISNSWSTSSLLLPRYCEDGAAMSGKVFYNCPDSVQIFNTSTGSCAIAKLSIPRSLLSVTAVGNKVYFAGGLNDQGALDRVDVYDNSADSWSYFSLREPKTEMAAIAVGNKIFWAGGYNLYNYGPNGNLVTNKSAQVEIYDINTQTSTTACLFQPAAGHNYQFRAVLKNNRILFFNGSSNSNKFDIYNPSTGEWSVGMLPFSVSGATIVSLNNTVYITAPNVNGQPSAQVYKLEF